MEGLKSLDVMREKTAEMPSLSMPATGLSQVGEFAHEVAGPSVLQKVPPTEGHSCPAPQPLSLSTRRS